MRRSQKLRVPEGVGPLVCGDALVLPKADPAMEYPAWPAGVLRCEDRRITLWLARDRRKRQLERNPGGEQLTALHSRHQRCCDATRRRRALRGPSTWGRPSSSASSASHRLLWPRARSKTSATVTGSRWPLDSQPLRASAPRRQKAHECTTCRSKPWEVYRLLRNQSGRSEG